MRITLDYNESTDPAALVAAIKALRPPASDGCCWEDCSLDAVYCHGHALELCGVVTEGEAELMRGRLAETVRTFEAFLAMRGDPKASPEARSAAWADLVKVVGKAGELVRGRR